MVVLIHNYMAIYADIYVNGIPLNALFTQAQISAEKSLKAATDRRCKGTI